MTRWVRDIKRRIRSGLGSRGAAGLASVALAAFAVGCSAGHPSQPNASSSQALTTIAFVQQNYSAPSTPQASVSVPLTAAQKAGDLNVVIVGWNDASSQVVSVSDTKGNGYQIAVGPTIRSGAITQTIYYAKNILAAAANANSVAVTFSAAANYPDVRVLEYSGVDPSNPLDVTQAASGSSASSNSGSVTTFNANDLLVGGNTVATSTKSAASGYTSRVITNDGDIAEDRIVSATGSYSASASLNGSGPWVMQLAAFRTAGGDTQPPTAPTNLVATVSSGSQIRLSWGASTDNVGVSSYLIERCQGVGCASFAQIGTATGISYNDTGLTAATSYSYRVRAADAANNLSGYAGVVTATTVASDTQPPSVPSNLSAASVSISRVDLSWTVSTDNVGVTTYLIERCQGTGCSSFAQIASAVTAAYSDTGLTGSTSYSYRVRATDAAGNRSGYSSTASAVTLTPDTQAPSAPSNLALTQTSMTQVTLTWTASSDNVGVSSYLIERCQGSGCSSFAQIATAPGTTYGDAGLNASNSYSYRVRATDAANNLSPYSGSVSSAPLPDTQPPSAPSTLSAAAVSTTQINLAWSAATDDVGVTGYLVERCQGSGCSSFTPLISVAGTSYSDNGLIAAVAYSYRVHATDAAGNLGPYSSVASATTQSTVTAPPAFVQASSATPQSSASVIVTYAGAQTAGNLNVVMVGWSNVAPPQVASVTDTKGNTYALAVGPTVVSGTASQVIYYAKNIAAATANQNRVTVAFSASASFPDVRILEYSGVDQTSPVDVAVGASGNSNASSSGAAVTTAGSDLLVAGDYVAGTTTGPGSGFSQRVLTSPDGSIAEDRVAVSPGSYSGTAPVSTGWWIMQMVAFRAASADAQVPTAPTNLVATATSGGQINLSWLASTDNIAVSGYLIERCQGAGCASFAQIGAATSVGYNDSGLVAGTSYSYRVRAMDAAGNRSGYSSTASAVTLTPDTQPPSAPSNLALTQASMTQVTLTWTASSDNVGVSSYLIERCQGSGCSSFAQIATTPAMTYGDAGLSASVSYTYRVRATDAANNLSSYSSSVSSTPLADTQPPSAPSNLSATAVSSTQINLAWSAATDDVGVADYVVERCQGLGCLSFAPLISVAGTSYSDTGLSVGSSYSYRVQAADAAGNLGPYSNLASATAQSTGTATPAFVQANSANPMSAPTVVTVTYTGAQTAGDLNVVVVGWTNGSSQVPNVTDAKGNIYALAVGPTAVSGAASQLIYYAKNIAAATANQNIVTITFASAADHPDIRIAEYSGVDLSNPLDVAVGATGTGNPSNSGSIVTTGSSELIVAANLVQQSTLGAGPGFTQRILTAPNSDILEDRVVPNAGSYSATAPIDSGWWIMQMAAFRPGAAPPPPTVSVTAPIQGATLSGTVSVTVSAQASGGVGGVHLVVDGLPAAVPDTVSPYAVSLDTTKYANGAHSVSAYAWSSGGQIGNATPVAVTFSNSVPGNPARDGIFSGAIPLPIVSVHVHLLASGKLLMSEGQSFGPDTRIWDPVTGVAQSIAAPVNIFCAGHEQMADGRIFVAGGHQAAHVGLTSANVFDPSTQSWTVLPDMTEPRWYPTVTTLSDGRLLVLSGETSCSGCAATTPEIYNPATNAWTQLSSAQFNFPYYPLVYGLPDGRMLVASSYEEPMVSQVLNLNNLTWTSVGGPAVDGGSATMYRPGKFLKTGNSHDPDAAVQSSSASAYVLDMTLASPLWRQIASMNYARFFHTMTVLPDGNVLVTGGGATTAETDVANAVLTTELWSPATETWSKLAAMNVPRLYHSEALLLPDGRVFISGGGRADDATLPTDQFSGEFYLPPYLFKGSRPTITSAPSTLHFGQAFSVQTPDASRIASTIMIRLGSVTHTVNMGQRFVPLSFTTGTGSLTVTAPVDGNAATPGNYMLFLVDTNGVPSTATIVRL